MVKEEWQEERPLPNPLVQSQYEEMTAHCVANRGVESCDDDQAVAARWRAAERRVRLGIQKAALQHRLAWSKRSDMRPRWSRRESVLWAFDPNVSGSVLIPL